MRDVVARSFLGSSVILIVLASVVGLARQGQQGQQAGQAQGQAQGQQQGRGGAMPQNVKVLPKTWTRQQVMSFMRTFTVALGVQCTHCHAGTPPQLNYPSDEKPTKDVARKMIHMVMHINDEHLKGIGSATTAEPRAAGAPPPLGTLPEKVTCFTCHRGALTPATAPAAGGGN
jgi:photosynthetic reaction center cytochrome c subunit